jgi:hypothetical protein
VSEPRLSAKLEVSALLRTTDSAGGFGVVLKKGEPDGGTILIVMLDNQKLGNVFERMPALDGGREWTHVSQQDALNPNDFELYLQRRALQDPDLWIVELSIADGERLILNQSH